MSLVTTIAGIPCVIEIDDYGSPGTYNHNCDSDWDYYGCPMTWSVYDRKGYPAKWLERKLTDSDRVRIDKELAQSIKEAF